MSPQRALALALALKLLLQSQQRLFHLGVFILFPPGSVRRWKSLR